MLDTTALTPVEAKKPPLNAGQRAAADAFFVFLLSNKTEFGISGPPGVGKSFLLGCLIDEIMPQYFNTCKLMGITPEYDEVNMTATTNKASEILGVATARPTETIYSFMNLKVVDDYTTGKSRITPTNNWVVHQRKIIIIDEASMIPSALDTKITDGTHGCKIVYVGDKNQLGPVMEDGSPIYKKGITFHELLEPMRTTDPDLLALNDQLRETVETGLFKPIKIVPGVIDLLTPDQMQIELAKHFANQTLDSKILAFTNKKVIDYNDYIRDLRGLAENYTVGEFLINNSAIRLKNRMLSVEEEIEIISINDSVIDMPIEDGVDLKVKLATIRTRIGDIIGDVPLVQDRKHFSALLAHYKRIKKWERYYYLSNNFPDFRQRDASTFYKAQGSTYDTVFIDLGDFSTCTKVDQAARMLYVGASRTRKRIFFYGNLAEKYGGLIH